MQSVAWSFNSDHRAAAIMGALLALVPASAMASAQYSRSTGFKVVYDVATTEPGHSAPMREFALARFQIVADKHLVAQSGLLEVQALGGAAVFDGAFEVADKALLTVCAYIPCSLYDERAKAQYLAEITQAGIDLERRHIDALIETIGRFELRGRIAGGSA